MKRVFSRRRLTCRQLVELVTDYLEAALSPRDGVRFERHLAACPACRAYLDQMRRTVGLLRRFGAAWQVS